MFLKTFLKAQWNREGHLSFMTRQQAVWWAVRGSTSLTKKKVRSQSDILSWEEISGVEAINKTLKHLMINHAFQFVNRVIFHIGATNFRSQKAIEKLGAEKFEEIEVAYYGEPVKWNFGYKIEKNSWLKG